MVDALAERRAVQPLAQHFRRENVGHPLDLIAGARMALHADAQGAQFFDPAPHRAERVTPISRAIFAPLMTIIVLSESSASSASMRRSVVPGKCRCAFHGKVGNKFSMHVRAVLRAARRGTAGGAACGYTPMGRNASRAS